MESSHILTPEDLSVFNIPNNKESADHVKKEILPKLKNMVEEAKKEIRRIYNVEPDDKMIFSAYPAFRSATQNPNYKIENRCADMGLTSKRLSGDQFYSQMKNSLGESHRLLYTHIKFTVYNSENSFCVLFWVHFGSNNNAVKEKFYQFYDDYFVNCRYFENWMGTRVTVDDEDNDANDVCYNGDSDSENDEDDDDCFWFSPSVDISEGLPVSAKSEYVNYFVQCYPLLELSYCLARGEPVNNIPRMIRRFLSQKDEFIGFDSTCPEEIDAMEYWEGTVQKVLVNRYERDKKGRERCLQKHGYHCSVCGFDFLNTYGEIGRNFIHIHHLIPIASVGEAYLLNPEEDLRPICPNCHAMLHRKQSSVIEIVELKQLIEKAKQILP